MPYQWDFSFRWHYSHLILIGAAYTIGFTIITAVAGFAIGCVVAIARLSDSRILSAPLVMLVEIFRCTPVLVQLVWIYYALPVLIGVELSPAMASFIALSFYGGAFYAEIIRGGIVSIDTGQWDAGRALGMRRMDIMRRIVLPQAMRVVIPPTGNETISMLKTTSLAAFASFVELFKATQDISANIFKQIPLLMVASVWYLIFTSVLSVAQYYIERHYARGSSRELPPTPIQRLRSLAVRAPRGV